MKSLGTLKYHKTGCQSVEFSRSIDVMKDAIFGDENRDDGVESEDEMSHDEKVRRARWLVGGGKDHRVSIWALMNFDKT